MISANVYRQVQASTASPDRMMVLLFQAAVRHMRMGRTAIEKRDRRVAIDSIERSSAIILELQRALKPELAPELCNQLHELYAFVVGRLTLGAVNQDVRYVDEAERIFAPIADAFVQAVDKAQAEKGQAGAQAPKQAQR